MENQIIDTRYANKQKLFDLLKQLFPKGSYIVEVSVQPHPNFVSNDNRRKAKILF